MTDYDWDAIDHYSRGWAAGYRAACERAEGPTEPMPAMEMEPEERQRSVGGEPSEAPRSPTLR